MKRIFFILTVFILIASCRPAQIVYRDVVKTDTITNTQDVYRDTTLYIHIPGENTVDSIIIKEPYVITRNWNSDTLQIRGFLATSFSWVANGALKGELVERDTLLPYKLDSAIKVTERLTKINTSLTEEVKENDSFWKKMEDLINKIIILLVVLGVVILVVKLIPSRKK